MLASRAQSEKTGEQLARSAAWAAPLFQMMGVFAEFERAMIQERVRAGLRRAKSEGKQLGRPPIAPELVTRIREARAAGLSVRKVAARFGVAPGTVQNLGPFAVDAASAAIA